MYFDYDNAHSYLTVDGVTVHEDFVYYDTTNDIALLKLNTSVDKHRLLTPCMKSYEEEVLAACGVGTQFLSYAPTYPPTLRETVFKQRSGADCPAPDDSAEVICTTSDGLTKAPCFGDSGGPMYPLVGGSSLCVYGIGSRTVCQWQSFFMSVPAYLHWINKHMK